MFNSKTIHKKITNITYNNHFYRIVESNYVDDLLNKGEIKLTTFERCRNFELEHRKDSTEACNKIECVDRTSTVIINAGLKVPGYMLCLSKSTNGYKEEDYKNPSCFEVINLHKLIEQITISLLKSGYDVISVLQGHCFYSDKTIIRTLEKTKINDMFENKTKEKFTFDTINKCFEEVNPIAEMLFNKDTSYSYENEYRVIWIINGKYDENGIVIQNKNIVNLCKKVF